MRLSCGSPAVAIADGPSSSTNATECVIDTAASGERRARPARRHDTRCTCFNVYSRVGSTVPVRSSVGLEPRQRRSACSNSASTGHCSSSCCWAWRSAAWALRRSPMRPALRVERHPRTGLDGMLCEDFRIRQPPARPLRCRTRPALAIVAPHRSTIPTAIQCSMTLESTLSTEVVNGTATPRMLGRLPMAFSSI